MTTNVNPETERTYRLAFAGLWAASALSLAGFVTAGYPLVGVAAFAVLVVAAFGVTARYDGPLFDERDDELHRTAAGQTLALFGWASAAFFPTLTALWGLGVVEWPAWVTPVALFIPLLYGTYLALLLVNRR
jgi:fatty acid desaturase